MEVAGSSRNTGVYLQNYSVTSHHITSHHTTVLQMLCCQLTDKINTAQESRKCCL